MALLIITSKPTVFPMILLIFLYPYSLVKAQPTNNPDPYLRPDPVHNTATVTQFTVAFVLIYLIFYYSLNSFFRRPSGQPSPARTMGQIPLARGLDPSVLRTFPVFTYSEVAGLRPDKSPLLECAVCLGMFEDDETLRLLLKCDHVFHVECVDTWLERHSTCPYCRAELEPRLPGESSRVEEPEEKGEVNEEGNDAVVERREDVAAAGKEEGRL